MASEPGGARPLALDTAAAREYLQPRHDSVARQLPPDASAASSTNVAAVPAIKNPPLHRPSQHAASPKAPASPRHSPGFRRTFSASSPIDRQPPSPSLSKKSSRASLHTQQGDEAHRATADLIVSLRESQMTIHEPAPVAASQIAIDHFARELASHTQPGTAAGTAVILHDACYGHRYSRLKTTKATLSMIVERPERIIASALGVSTAYVRLGGHHSGGKSAPRLDTTPTARPPFTIRRTARTLDVLSPYVTAVHGTAWMSELKTLCDSAGARIAAGARELERADAAAEPQKQKLHEGDLYLCDESLNAFQGALGGVADAVDAVFDQASQTERAFVAVRPPGHHCSADYPSGFCWLNNVHVGIEYAAQVHGLTHAAILDFDLHHGDGSQAITWARNSANNAKRLGAKANAKLRLAPDVGYYSLHDINSYPCEMGDDDKVQAASLCVEDAHGQSIWNVHLQPWKTETEFWQLYESRYATLIDKAKVFLQKHTARVAAERKTQPKAAIFISAGFDASEWEGQGMQRHKVNVPTEFYARFTRDVVQIAQDASTGCDGRVISVLEGGYSDRALCSGVLSHLSGLCAAPTNEKDPAASAPLDEMMRSLALNSAPPLFYDKTWWSPANLNELELKGKAAPPATAAPAKKAKIGQQPTYATPTESFAHKVVDANKFARSVSGTMRDIPKPVRPATSPPPEVNWVVAAQELSQLLVPAYRQTKSCTAEELGGVRSKKDRQSAAAVLTTEESSQPRQLRDRKTKVTADAEAAHPQSEGAEAVTSANRRQTISDLPWSDPAPIGSQPRRASRRLSAGSALGSTPVEVDPNAPAVPPLPLDLALLNGGAKPSAGAGQDFAVKKTRVPAKVPIKKPTPASPSGKKPIVSQPPLDTMAAPPSKDVDALTSGLKRITLKVGSREEHDRKLKEKLDAERRARALKAAETRKTNAAAKKAATVAGVGVSSGGPVALGAAESATENGPSVSSAVPQLQTSQPRTKISDGLPPAAPEPVWNVAGPLPEVVAPKADLSAIPATGSNAQTTSSMNEGPTTSLQPSTFGGLPSIDQGFGQDPTQQVFGAPAPPHQPIAPVRPHGGSSLPWVGEHGNSDGSRPMLDYGAISDVRPSSRDRLPVWSSTGAIPFAPVNAATPVPAKVEQDAGIWDVPDTPQRQPRQV